MIERLSAPLKPAPLAAVALAAAAAVTLYCLAYTALAGGSETAGEALAWSLVNVLPWIPAFEAAKRARTLSWKLAALAAALMVSMAAGAVLQPTADFAFELVRRLPGLLAAGGLAVLVPWTGAKSRNSAAGPPSLPVAHDQIEWVAAAGNYVELHIVGRVVLHRAPLSTVESQLAAAGFVRVHRSTLVRRDLIARVRPLDLVLRDGTMVRTGKRYRANLVPSSLSAGSARDDPA